MGRVRNVALVSVVLCGCATTIVVGTLNPRSNVAVGTDDEHTLGLSLGPEVRNDFDLPARNRIPETQVHSWHGTLSSGFHEAFAPYFHVAEPADLVIAFDRADIGWAPMAVSARGRVTALDALVQYRARLVDASGKVLGVAADTARSKSPAVDYDGLGPCLTGAV
ncbi:MAG: hypothetical protein ACJ79V_25945, partial [Myxococcales bacterium]